jgi:nitrite reductase/ring-hydroxylating ferredoxin subunit
MAGEIQRGSGSAALRCRWHGLEFDGCGGSINGKGKLSLRRYPANVRGEKIFITYVR